LPISAAIGIHWYTSCQHCCYEAIAAWCGKKNFGVRGKVILRLFGLGSSHPFSYTLFSSSATIIGFVLSYHNQNSNLVLHRFRLSSSKCLPNQKNRLQKLNVERQMIPLQVDKQIADYL
jgi:hypothetical protein